MRQVLIYPGEDGFWIAECPSLPGCISQGETRQEAVTNIREAIDLYVEVLDEAQQPIPGLARSDCRPFTGDSVRHPIQWQHNLRLTHLEGTPVRLRFHLKKAKFFSFTFR